MEQMLRGKKLSNGSLILDVKPEQYILLSEQGDPYTMRKTPYNHERYVLAGDKRIGYVFNKKNSFMETPNKRLFNCVYKGIRFQTRMEYADAICELVQRHRSGDKRKATDEFTALVDRAARETPMYSVIDPFLGQMAKVRKTKKGWWVHDGHFLVDLKGTSWFYKNGKEVNHFCLVLDGRRREPQLPGPDGEPVDINPISMSIISKVMWMLYPKIKGDSWVEGQLNSNPEHRTILENHLEQVHNEMKAILDGKMAPKSNAGGIIFLKPGKTGAIG